MINRFHLKPPCRSFLANIDMEVIFCSLRLAAASPHKKWVITRLTAQNLLVDIITGDSYSGYENQAQRNRETKAQKSSKVLLVSPAITMAGFMSNREY